MYDTCIALVVDECLDAVSDESFDGLVVLEFFTFFRVWRVMNSKRQPGLIKICHSVHFLCVTVLRTLLHISPQFQRDMSTEWR